MTGFEPGSSGIGSDRSANCATTTALQEIILFKTCSLQFATIIKSYGSKVREKCDLRV